MREIRPSGSEGGETGINRSSLPLSCFGTRTRRLGASYVTTGLVPVERCFRRAAGLVRGSGPACLWRLTVSRVIYSLARAGSYHECSKGEEEQMGAA
jgi:hypothetical protein